MKTAYAVLWENQDRGETDQTGHPNIEKVYKARIEFAKMHVKAALREASEGAETEEYIIPGVFYVNRDSILNAYPLDNIK